VSQGAAEVVLWPRDLRRKHRFEGHAPTTMVFSSGSVLRFPWELTALHLNATAA